ncbi:MAG TPA: potassium-transporting ATPase subunit KdpC [Bryobacteraceae bacterium]|jgi:K+-transporting ATPase ATPase C chain
MWKELKPAILVTVMFTILTGIVYPLAVTGAAKAMFPSQARGSLIEREGKVVGSELIGQNFTRPEYFHPRPSAAGTGYDAGASSGSNLGPTNPALVERLAKDAAKFREENPRFEGAIPADAITTSGSGLDPDISPANALAQAERVALARGVPADSVRQVILASLEARDLGVLGEPRVNVLKLNLTMDEKAPIRK